MILGAIAIVYGAWVAMVQPDMKKLVAYSSVSHMGYVIFGLFSLNEIAVTGSLYQMLNHGISTGALFLLVGMIYERRHTREISAFGGITKVMPLFRYCFNDRDPFFDCFARNEWVYWRVFDSPRSLEGQSSINSCKCLRCYFWGSLYALDVSASDVRSSVKSRERRFEGFKQREFAVLVPLIAAVFFMGIYPDFFFAKMKPSIDQFLQLSQIKTDTPKSTAYALLLENEKRKLDNEYAASIKPELLSLSH